MWFKRSDGVLFSADEGSASATLMLKDGGFTPCDEEGNELVPEESPAEESDEGKTDAEQSDLEDGKPKKDPGQSGPAKRGRARKRDKADDPK